MNSRSKSGAGPRPAAGSQPASLEGWRIAAAKPDALDNCTLIVATYQRPREVATLLERTAALAEPPGEILIVDGSPERDVEKSIASWASSRMLAFDLVYVRSPKGLTRQRNVGIDLATRDIICFLDDDAFPLEGYFRALCDVFTGDRTRRVGAVGASIVNEMDRQPNRRWRLRLQLGLVPRTHPMIYHECGTANPSSLMKPFHGVIPVDLVQGGASAFRREVFDTMRFSEFFYGYAYGEDAEMSLRVKNKWEVLWCGDARCEHHPAPGGRPTSFGKGRMEVRNKVFIWRRHRSYARWINRIRFHGDFGYLFLWDIAWFLIRPWHFRWLAHAAGLLAGAVECAVRPPTYTEPPVRRRYVLETRETREQDKAEVAPR
jgi:GT2 family glycosyltransferase